jgi:hypothetical protein
MVPTGRAAGGPRIALGDVLALVAAVAVGLALDRAYAPSLFTRSASNLGDRLAILAIILTPCVALALTALLILRAIQPRLRWRPPDRLGLSLVVLGVAMAGAIVLMAFVMRAVVGLAQ